MKTDLTNILTGKDDKFACAYTDKIVEESQNTDEWYEYFDEVAMLLSHSKSLVRNRAMYIIAANVQWDDDDKFASIKDEYFSHITDEKPITARQCIKTLAKICQGKPELADEVLMRLHSADLSSYKDSMRPLIEKDIQEAVSAIESKQL